MERRGSYREPPCLSTLTPAMPNDAQPAAPAQVWLADDSPSAAEHTRRLLAGTDYQIETFADGASLLERLAQPAVQAPDLLLLDWHMPGVSGLEVCRFLRQRFLPTELPILVLTASTHEGDIEEAFGAGANDYVATPARPVELRARVRTLLQARRDAEALRAQERERERLLAEVEAARVRLVSLFENAPALVCTFRGPQLVYEFSNPLHQRLVGAHRQLVGRPVREAVPEAVDQGLVATLECVYRTGEPYLDRELAVRLDRRGDGTLVDAFLNVVYQPARDAAGHVVGVDVFGFEVTEQVLARQRVEALAERLRESEERLRRVLEASGMAAWELDVATGAVSDDPRHVELLGLAPGTPLTLGTVMEAIHSDSREQTVGAIAAALAGKDGGRYLIELSTQGVDGGPGRWLEGRGQALFDAQGRPVRLVGTTVDVTARKAAEDAREELLDAFSEQPLFGVALFRGPRFVFERANATYRQLVGGRDVEGKPLLEALPEFAGQGLDTMLHDVWRTGTPVIAREALVRMDRSGRGVLEDGYFDLVFQPVRTPGGASEDVLHIILDVTDRVHARKEAERLMALEQERAGFEQQLIGIVSHDLRTPIAAITMGAAVLLRRPDVEERQRRTVERILSSAGRANRMIHDLLDFTQARLGGGIKAQRLPIDFHAIVRQVVEESQVSNPGRILRLTQTGDGRGECDADRLSQLVSNLLSNALHYSPPDSVVRIETRGEPEQLVLTVRNAGAPISSEVLPRLFQPMQRGVGGYPRRAASAWASTSWTRWCGRTVAPSR